MTDNQDLGSIVEIESGVRIKLKDGTYLFLTPQQAKSLNDELASKMKLLKMDEVKSKSKSRGKKQ